MKAHYITTAIDYANGRPHLGHTYEKILADVMARVQRLRGVKVHFLTGLDEHGQKVQQTAKKNGAEPQLWCNGIAAIFQDFCKQLNISNDDYIRTTEPRHKEIVQQILQDFYDRGEIYKKEYSGYYSLKEEQFLQDKDRNPDGTWPEQYGEVKEMVETNYFFRLARHQQWLVEYINAHENIIFPQYRRKQVLEFLKDPINDLCISRPKERLEWGIPLPFDNDYVTYVWFDALINYISAVKYGTDAFGECWPVDAHVIGKDILVPAHAIYWPIMLHVAGVAMPKQFVVHGWWTVSGSKMSKSVGNVVDPAEYIKIYGADALRYFLIREMNVGQDSDFSDELFVKRYNSDLANDLGNLLNRALNMTHRYNNGVVPNASVEEAPERELQTLWAETLPNVMKAYDTFQFHTGLEQIFTFVRAINRYVEQRAPWKLAADPAARAQLETSLAYIAEGLRLASLLLWPVMPATTARIHEALALTQPERWSNEALAWSHTCSGKTILDKLALFPKFK